MVRTDERDIDRISALGHKPLRERFGPPLKRAKGITDAKRGALFTKVMEDQLQVLLPQLIGTSERPFRLLQSHWLWNL